MRNFKWFEEHGNKSVISYDLLSHQILNACDIGVLDRHKKEVCFGTLVVHLLFQRVVESMLRSVESVLMSRAGPTSGLADN